MNQEISPTEQKLRAVMLHAPIGLIDIDENGTVANVNLMGSKLLGPILNEKLIRGVNIFPALTHISPEIVEKIRSFEAAEGLIMLNQHYSCQIIPEGLKHFKCTLTKMFVGCIIVSVEDVTEKYLEDEALKQAQQDKAVAQGKYDIASEVLHDIGNAVVGFGSHLTRVSRMLEQGNKNNLQNVLLFLKQQQDAIAGAIGDSKAVALVTMMEGIYKSESDMHEELQKSLVQQLNIITHIQDILNIQRQYVSGHESQDRKSVNLKEIINDCWSMVAANIEKKGITLSLAVPPTPTEIKGDRTKLMQVVLNILKNSIEAIDMNADLKKVTVKLEDLGTVLKLTISDTGIGFDPEVTKNLFDRGYTTKETGTGLGLYNCKVIIESHNGSISLKSNGVGNGSQTMIELSK